MKGHDLAPPKFLSVQVSLTKHDQFIELAVKFQNAFIDLQRQADRYKRRIEAQTLTFDKYPRGNNEWVYVVTVRTHERSRTSSPEREHNVEE